MFNILDYVHIFKGTADERQSAFQALFPNQSLSQRMAESASDSVVIEVDKVYPVMLARIREWVKDGHVSIDEVSELQLTDDDIALKIPQIADNPAKVEQYRRQVLNHYQSQFNQLHDSVWTILDTPSASLSQIERDECRKAMQLIRDVINRCITVKLGGVNTRFLIRGDGDEVWKV